MKFSIVTPSFNQGKYISKCIDSVQSQEGVDIEHIILDNCSDDETKDILGEYKEKYKKYKPIIFVEKDKGQTSAINKGFRVATGDVVAWLNTDEWYNENVLIKVKNFFEKNPDIDVVFGGCSFVDKNGVTIKDKIEKFYSYSMLIYYGCYIPSCSTFIRSSVLKDKDIYLDDSFKVTMDYDWYVNMASQGIKFAVMPELLANFTWHENNISSNYVEKRLKERLYVQLKYGNMSNNVLTKLKLFLMRYFWIAIRNFSRMVK